MDKAISGHLLNVLSGLGHNQRLSEPTLGLKGGSLGTGGGSDYPCMYVTCFRVGLTAIVGVD